MEEEKQPPAKLPESEEEQERVIKLLEERLEKHDDNRKAVQNKLAEILNKLRAQIGYLEDRINRELCEKFTPEEDRLQAALNELRGNGTISALQKAKAELLVEQLYELIENNSDSKHDLTTLYELKAERRIIPELMEMRKPKDVNVTDVNRGRRVSVGFACLNPDEERVLSDKTIVNPVKYKCLLFKKWNEQESKEYPLDKDKGNNSSSTFTPDFLEAETTYGIKVKMAVEDRENEWSDVAEFTTPEFRECCAWKECPDDVGWVNKYSVDEKNPRIATKANSCGYYCTIIGNTYIPLGKVTSWSVKVLKSIKNDGNGINVGVAPFDIDQNDASYTKCGWYFDCCWSTLRSGPPHKYNSKEYGPRKERGQYVHTGDSVGVVMDTKKGDLSFVLNGVNLGVAFEGIPLDKPLVPCVILDWGGDSVELDTSEAKENVDSSIPVLPITTKDITWDSIALTWDEVVDASFYQVEMDGSILCGAATKNVFVKEGFFPETKYNFRVRTVRGSTVSEWSDVVKGRTPKAPELFECVWKECPDYVDDKRKYSVDGRNPRIATKANSDGDCIIIGNTRIPLNTVATWNIKTLKSMNNNGYGISIGIASFDINQNVDNYYNGWYFDCYFSTLHSGPPHKYRGKEYGPRKESSGQYVHTGDSAGVVVDTTKGDLSFVLNGVNYGVAYEGIPLDKPLVPCVLLYYQGDSVELII